MVWYERGWITTRGRGDFGLVISVGYGGEQMGVVKRGCLGGGREGEACNDTSPDAVAVGHVVCRALQWLDSRIP